MPNKSAFQLKEEFDEQFASPRVLMPTRTDEFLIIRVGASRFALRVQELGGMFRCPKVIPFPSENAAVMGLLGVQGSIVVVYDTGMLLGATAARSATGWILLRRTDRSCGLFFDAPEGYRVVPRESIVSSREDPLERHDERQVFLDDVGTISIVGQRQLDSAIFGTTPL